MIDPKKQYRTRDGREVRIYAVDGADPYPVHGAIKMDGKWGNSAWRADGGYLTHFNLVDPSDLIEVKPRIKREVWANVYPEGHFNCGAVVGYTTKHDADHSAIRRERIACVKLVIDCEEGEGL